MKLPFSSFQIIAIATLKLVLLSAFLFGFFSSKILSDEGNIEPLPATSIEFDKTSKIPDFSVYTDTDQKKADFFAFLLPKALASNEAIIAEREKLISIEPEQELSTAELDVLNTLAEKYKVELESPEEIHQELLKRVDIIPPSLVLAQAANESAWGTSRFAKKGNNLFGQWCYVKGCGVIPKKRGNKERHEVAKFKNIQKSVQSYMLNLNTQYSYEDLREIRATMRKKGRTIGGRKIANGLLKYSTRREAYVHEIQAMIKQNSLSEFDIIE